MDKFELQKLRDLPIEGVAERLGLRVVRHKALCPFHADHHPSLAFHVSKNTFRCFVCGASGGTIDLVMRHLGKDFLDACRWLDPTKNFNPLQTSPRGGLKTHDAREYSSPRGGQEGVPFDASRYERFFEHPWLSPEARKFLFEERKIDPRVVRWCRLTSWKDRNGTPWLQIPYFDQQGKLIGIQNRNLTPSQPPRGEANEIPSLGRAGEGAPRFRFPQGSQCVLYNQNVLNLLRPGEPLYITEGCSDCWAMLSAGKKAVSIPSATLFKPKDAELLRSLSDSNPSSPRGGREGVLFHMYPDRDAPGERLFLQLQQVLPSLVHHQLPVGCKDFSDYWLQSLSCTS